MIQFALVRTTSPHRGITGDDGEEEEEDEDASHAPPRATRTMASTWLRRMTATM
jgi:hypothetical protein